MPETLPSKSTSTAELVAAVRGWHQRAARPIVIDPYAQALCGGPLGFAVRFSLTAELLVRVLLRKVMPVSMCVLMRARYSEQALEAAVDGGVTQYAIIGAGMDSFAFRRPDLLERLQVFELDHPVTQAKKRRRMRKAGLEAPDRLHFVAADLSKVTPVEALAGSAFDATQPTFLSLLGVAYYLTSETLAQTARSLSAGLPAGSRLVLDYLLDEESSNPADLGLRKETLAFVERRGEPMRSEYALADMDQLMAAQGFRTVENLAIQNLEEEYIRDFGELPFQIPGLFGFGTFEIAERPAGRGASEG